MSVPVCADTNPVVSKQNVQIINTLILAIFYSHYIRIFYCLIDELKSSSIREQLREQCVSLAPVDWVALAFNLCDKYTMIIGSMTIKYVTRTIRQSVYEVYIRIKYFYLKVY